MPQFWDWFVMVSRNAASAVRCSGVRRSIWRSRPSSAESASPGTSKKAFMDKPSSQQTSERFSTEIPFSPSSTARRKLWEIPQRLASRLVVQPLASTVTKRKWDVYIFRDMWYSYSESIVNFYIYKDDFRHQTSGLARCGKIKIFLLKILQGHRKRQSVSTPYAIIRPPKQQGVKSDGIKC